MLGTNRAWVRITLGYENVNFTTTPIPVILPLSAVMRCFEFQTKIPTKSNPK
jgi:hypothetical protein